MSTCCIIIVLNDYIRDRVHLPYFFKNIDLKNIVEFANYLLIIFFFTPFENIFFLIKINKLFLLKIL